MNALSQVMLASIVVAAFASTAQADEAVHTRSPEAAYADLIRDWNYKGSGIPGLVRLRSPADIYADLMRDWKRPATATKNASAKSMAAGSAARNTGGAL